MDLSIPVDQIWGIGPVCAKHLRRLGIFTARDLLFYFPRRYQDFSKIVPTSKLRVGENVSVAGSVVQVTSRRTKKRGISLVELVISDNAGMAKAVWFNQLYLKNSFRAGDKVMLSGKVEFGISGVQLTNPSWEKLEKFEEEKNIHTARIVPIYPETLGLSSKRLRRIIKPLLVQVSQVEETLTEEIRKRNDVPEIQWAIKRIHFPETLKDFEWAKRRFAFEEMLVLQLANLRAREKIARSKAPKILFDQKLARSFIENLPFELTYDQKKTAWEILQDLQREIPMNRLLQGDVGSGKTVVAAMCALQVIKSGFQVVLMAPTEILAQQHYKTFEKILRPFNVKTTLITSSTSGVNLETSGVELFIGTHALISGKVRFKNLGLVIIDEQHRFGVSQRSLLVNKASCQDRLPAAVSISGLDTAIPHFLSMTATPIPRTLALTVYGDLDISVIKEKPAGRKQIISRLVEESDRAKAIQFVKEQIRQGRQVFVICPRIEGEDEEKSAKAVYKKMTEEDFKEFKVGLLHGRQKTKEKEETMQKFVRGDLDILVSTTVVEVGVDVPNATVMWIEGAEHFGLATLHQLRGRVGRGEYRSYCLLFFSPDLSDISRSRLKAFVLSDNGFELAEKDLELRGPGELWGTRQHGLPELEYASLLDFGLIQKTKKEAELIFPVLDSFPGLKAKVEEFEINVHRE